MVQIYTNIAYIKYPIPSHQEPINYIFYSSHVGAPTTMNLNGTVTVQEGDSVNITCVAIGNPVPTISWYLGASLAPFSQSDNVINLEAILSRERQSDPPELRFTEGNITSVLHIINAVYPAHDGQYTCVGLNANRAGDNTNNAIITVQMLGRRLVAYYVIIGFCNIIGILFCRIFAVINP